MESVIRTERLVLRRAVMDDTADMHRLMSNPVAMRYWSTLPHDRLDQTEAWMRSMVDAPADDSDDFIVTLDGELIGKLGAWRLPEVGFLLDPRVWGCGFATEAMKAFIDRRRFLGSDYLTADVDPRNRQSLQLLDRCGFVETGRRNAAWKLGEEWCDSVDLRLQL